ncbi:MAG TPA: transposase [Coleofasciculaceae cyanobacterium]
MGISQASYLRYYFGKFRNSRQPIDLLSDRTAITLAEWLKEHPGVEIISRDRAKTYKEGASRGCPEAIQVADRFHLLQNLAQMLEVVLNQHRTLLKNVEDETNNCPIIESEKVVAQPIQPPPNPVEALKLAEVRREQRKEKYDQLWALHKQGFTGRAIARQLGIGRSSVFRYLRSPTFPERKGKSDKGRSKVSPYNEISFRKMEFWLS